MGRWIRRALRGVLLLSAGMFLCMALPGSKEIRTVIPASIYVLMLTILYLPFTAVPAVLLGELMPWIATVRSRFLVLALGAMVGCGFGLATDWALPPHRNPLPRLLSRPVMETTTDSSGRIHDPAPSGSRVVRRWISLNWTPCFFLAWFAGWGLLERRPAPPSSPKVPA